ncbi:MAG: cysteine-rich small domain-containing protein, partial [Lachnospiraceae bacterium]|nr:cysteine-rich small domain-containing protein [Lachnospiraceae bacterium]
MSEKREKPHWEGKHYSFFQNTECEYFPCHRIADPARFNCLFCYCPLYMLGPDCGGNFRYTEKGRKDCTGCLIPHLPENYGRITGKYAEIAAGMKKSGEIGEAKAQGKRSMQSTPQDGKISAAKTRDTQSTQETQLRSSSGRIVM